MNKHMFNPFLFLLLVIPVFINAGMTPAVDDGPCPGCPPPAMVPGNPGGPMHPPSILNFAEELNLTGDQFEKIKAIEKESSAIEAKNLKLMRKNMEDMRTELDKDSPDEKKLDAIIARLSDLHREMMTNQMHNMLKFKMLLTREQQKTLKDKFKRIGMGVRKGFPGRDE